MREVVSKNPPVKRKGSAPRVPPKSTLSVLKLYDPMGDFSLVAGTRGVTQQDFLLAAMHKLGFTRKQMAVRIGCGVKAVNKWLSPPESNDYHTMSVTTWKYLAEILIAFEQKSRAS